MTGSRADAGHREPGPRRLSSPSRPEARDHRPLDRNARRRQRLKDARLETRHSVEGDGDVGQQDDRIVVVRVHRHPRERSTRPRGPLRQQRRLSPAGARGQEDDRAGSRSPPSKSMSSPRGTARPRCCGARSFDSNSSNRPGPGGAAYQRLGGAGRLDHDISDRGRFVRSLRAAPGARELYGATLLGR